MLRNIELPAPNHSITLQDEFEAVALPHLNDLYRTARYVIGNAAEAEDIVQDTYYQAWKSFHRFEPGTNCRAWLYKILFHVTSHHRRRWLKWARATESEDILLDTAAPEPPVPQHLTDEKVLTALERVPQSFREAVLLSDVMDFSYNEIADTLQIPIGTVMSRLYRGRRLLRAELAGLAESYGIQIEKESAQVA